MFKGAIERHRGKVMAVVSFLLLTAAALMFLRRPDPLLAVPDRADLQATWACHSCGKVVSLTPRQRMMLERRATAGTVTVPGVELDNPPEATSFREPVLPCPECKNVDLRRAKICPRCETAFARSLQGETRHCPVCGPEPQRSKVPARPAFQRSTTHDPGENP